MLHYTQLRCHETRQEVHKVSRLYCVTGCLAVTAPPQSTAAIFCYGVQITFCAAVTVSFYCFVFYYSTTWWWVFFLISCILSTDLHAYTISVLCKNLEPPLNVLSFARIMCAGEWLYSWTQSELSVIYEVFTSSAPGLLKDILNLFLVGFCSILYQHDPTLL